MLKLEFDERDLRSLRVFCHVVEAGGFTAAQSTLFMSKASISRHIREVEERLGAQLCKRGPGGFRLTPEGEVAVKLANTALRELARIRPEVDAVRGILSGPLAIGIGEHALLHPDCRLPQTLRTMLRQAPQIQAEILVMPFAELGTALRTKRIDVAIRGKYREDQNFTYVPLYTEEHRFYAVAPLHRAPGALRLPLVVRAHPYVEHALSTRRYVRGPQAIGLDAVGALIATGCCQGILPVYYGTLLQHPLGLYPVEDSPSYSHQICAVIPASEPPSRRVEVFLASLRAAHAERSENRMDQGLRGA